MTACARCGDKVPIDLLATHSVYKYTGIDICLLSFVFSPFAFKLTFPLKIDLSALAVTMSVGVFNHDFERNCHEHWNRKVFQ